MKRVTMISILIGLLATTAACADDQSSVPVTQKVSLSAAVPTPAPATRPSPVTADISAAELCNLIAKKLGSVYPNDCSRGSAFVADGVSVNKKPIIVREYPPVGDRKPLGRVLMLGGIHGDEYSSVSIMFHWMRKLNEYHSGLFHWKVAPLVNPDGLLRRGSRRQNHNGVDLNRNFPTPNWQAESKDYWEKRTYKNPRRYPGPYPLSEPESQWLDEEIKSFKPDVIVSVHAPYGILDFDGPRKAPKRLGHLHLNLLGTYPGSLGNFAGVQKKIPVVTIELPYAGIMPSPGQVSKIWVDLIGWLKQNMPDEDNTRRAQLAGQDADPS